MDYSQQGVIKAQGRILERLGRLLTEHNVLLDPGSPTWFDGRMDLPKPGETWTMLLSSHGETRSVEFTPTELDDFLRREPREVISAKLRQAVAAFRSPKR
jgi:hypothetical protein